MAKTDKKEIILTAAMTLLAEEGFHGAPMAQIAEKAGVGAGTIYRYFENRDVLICEIHDKLVKDFNSILMKGYPTAGSVRDCFFYIGHAIIDYHIKHPIKFRYHEQFHHSPYGVEMRRSKLFEEADDYDFGKILYEKGMEQKAIKNIPVVLFFTLGFAPIFWAVRDHHTSFLNIDKNLAEIIVSACWDSIKA